MSRAPSVILLCCVACAGARRPATDEVGDPAPPLAAIPPTDAGPAPDLDPPRPQLAVDAGPAPVEALPPLPPLPPALAAAPAWVHRRLSTGMVPRQHALVTYRLHRAGRDAALVVEARTSDARGEAPDLGPWSEPSIEHLLGTATPEGRDLRLTLRAVDPRGPDHGYQLGWRCRPGRTPVAAADAVLVPRVAPGARPEGGECDGDPGRWVPARTRTIATLTCEPIDQPEDGVTLVFAAGAGVEHVRVDDDCDMQGEGLRRASPAGGVAPVRGPTR